MAKKPHPVDLIDAERIENAAWFNVHARKGPFEKYNQRCETLIEAVAVHDEWIALGRRPLVYAISPDTPQTIVGKARLDQERKAAR